LDSDGKPTEFAYYRHNGGLIAGPYGYARRTIDRDDKGVERQRRFFDANDEPIDVAVRVDAVVRESQGEKLKIQAGDILASYEGVRITDTSSLIYRRSKEDASDKPRPLVVQRGEEKLTFDVSPGPLGLELHDEAPSASAASDVNRP
jgi:S1-C subfamily serine protease